MNVVTFLPLLQDFLNSKCNISFNLEPEKWFLNRISGIPTENDSLSICAIIAKYYIYCCKVKGNIPDINVFKQKLKSYCSVELYSKFMYSEKKEEKIRRRWLVMRPLFE